MRTAIERAARALCDLEGGKWDAADFTETMGGCSPEEQRDAYCEQAVAVIHAMREPGLAIRKLTTFEFAEIEWPKLIDAMLEEGLE